MIFNKKFFVILTLVLFILTSSILMGYVNYATAKAPSTKFVSDVKADAGYVTVQDKDSRHPSPSEFYSNQKYFFIAPPVLNVVAMLLSGYLIYTN